MKWIDVKERLPELGETVYVYGIMDEYSGETIRRAFLLEDDYTWRCEEDYYEFQEVRCWMKIPEIPPVPERFKRC